MLIVNVQSAHKPNKIAIFCAFDSSDENSFYPVVGTPVISVVPDFISASLCASISA